MRIKNVKKILFAFIFILTSCSVHGVELVNLTQPIKKNVRVRTGNPDSEHSSLIVGSLVMNWKINLFRGTLLDADTKEIVYSFMYTGAEAKSLMDDLTKGDFTVNSIHKTVMEKLIQEGRFSGTVFGRPD